MREQEMLKVTKYSYNKNSFLEHCMWIKKLLQGVKKNSVKIPGWFNIPLKS